MSANQSGAQGQQGISSQQPSELLQRLDFHLENVPLGVIEWDCQLRVIRWSRGAEVLFGWQAHEVMGRRPDRSWRFIYPADRRVVVRKMGQLFRGQMQRSSLSYRNYTKAGEILNCEWYNSVLLDPAGGVESVLSLVLDVTQRTQAEMDLQQQSVQSQLITETWMALRESEERFNQLTESIQEVFWIRETPSNRVLYVSSACQSIWGCTPEDLYESTDAWTAHLHPDDRSRVLTTIHATPLTDYDLEYRILKPDGEIRWIRDRAFCLKDHFDQPNRITGLVEDITDRKQLEMELIRTVEKERAFSELRSQFVSMVSHEFRTPLSTILSASELLEYYGHTWTQAERIQQLHLIQDTVQSMTELLEDMLVLGRIEANRLEYSPKPVDLTRFCADLVAQLQSSIAREHRIEFTHKHSSSPVMVDEKLLRQILINLLSNAVKYSPAGSAIQFTLIYGPQIQFKITDQGIGIDTAELPKLYEPFYRAKNVGNVPGTGLGLAIVKHCVAAHQGEISVESQLGVGSTFQVTLPLVGSDSVLLPELS